MTISAPIQNRVPSVKLQVKHHSNPQIAAVTVDAIVDTGATSTSVPPRCTKNLQFVGRQKVNTANGPRWARTYTASVAVMDGAKSHFAKKITVIENDSVLAADGTQRALLGMDFLESLDVRFHNGIVTISP